MSKTCSNPRCRRTYAHSGPCDTRTDDQFQVVHSYGFATGTGPRPRHVMHILRDANEGTSLCGVKRVRFVGAVGQAYDESWPTCGKCEEMAGPNVMAGWRQ